jgi:macrodomain Ter protein organizer (MatP/YcbG family)
VAQSHFHREAAKTKKKNIDVQLLAPWRLSGEKTNLMTASVGV